MPKKQQPDPADEPKKRPRKPAGPKRATPIPAKKAAKPLPAKKAGAQKPTPAADPSALAKKLMETASKTARKAVKDNPAPVQQAPAPVADDDATDDAGPLMGCTPRQARFVDLYLALAFNGTQAYKEAGFTAKNDNVAGVEACRLLKKPRVRALLASRTKAMLDRTEAEQDRLLATLTGQAFVDPNDLVSWEVGACRYCYGAKHRYQYTAGEWDRKLEDHEAKREKAIAADKPDPGPLDGKGGTGYDKRKEPHPDCPECFGRGVGEMVMKDTRSLSPAARALYAGVKVGKDGTQILMHSQERARDTLAKVHRMYEEGGNVNLVFDADALTKKFEEKMAKSRARGAAMRQERFGKPGEDTAAG